MLYPTFIRLCDEATRHQDCQDFIMSLGWQEWMNESNIDDSIKDMSLIFELAPLSFSDLRKRIGGSLAAFSTLYRLPLRTVESWNCGNREPAPYIIDFIRFTAFIGLKEGTDGYLDYLTETD